MVRINNNPNWWIGLGLFVLTLWFLTWLLNYMSASTVTIEGFANGTYYYKKCSKRGLGKVLQEVFQKHGINKQKCKGSDCSQWNIYLPCGYTGVEKELDDLSPDNKKQLIFGIKGCDHIVSKNNIWKLLVKAYDREKAGQLMPKTYLARKQEDLNALQQDFGKTLDQVYILKKNLHRQTGLKLSNDLAEILYLCQNDPAYAVIQEMLPRPLCINKRKINLRVYVLVVCHAGTKNAYRHKDGFNYYTPAHYVPNSLKEDVNITSGYVPREVYQQNPLTHSDLRKYLKKHGYDPKLLFNNIDQVIGEVFEGVSPYLCKSNRLSENKSFQLFGIDIAPDEELGCRVIEINKGPDMGAKDDRDKAIKFMVQEDIFNLLGVLEYDEKEKDKEKQVNKDVKGNKKLRKNGFKLFWESMH